MSQLYALVSDSTEVDVKIDMLRTAGKIRMISIGVGSNDYGVVDNEDFETLLTLTCEKTESKEDKHAILAFRDVLLPEHRAVTITFDELHRALGPSGVKPLVQAGFLLLEPSGNEYRISFPRSGSLVAWLKGGKEEIVRHVKRKQFKEAMKVDLEAIKLKKSHLGMRFHLRDLQGKGLITVSRRPGGEVVRLA